SESVQNVLKNMDIKGVRDLVNITEDEDVKKNLELAKDLNSKAKEIKKITSELKASHNIADELHNSAEKMNKELGSFGPENPKGIILSIYWDNIKNSINKLYEFIKPIEQNIKGAEEYFNYSAELVNFIDAYIKAKINENERSKKYSQIQKQVEINNRIKERLEQMIESKIKSQNDEIKLLLFERLINIKY
ncbi:38039_t:CDS:2, partial [Gigaspora margarita]